MIGAASVQSSSIERFIASCSNEAELIWKVMREAPPGGVDAEHLLGECWQL
jgi:hypothetical protein